MIAKELISELVPPLTLADNGEKALAWMNEYQVRHLPIINEGAFVSLISEDEIYDLNDANTPFSKLRLSNKGQSFVKEKDHLYEVLKVASILKLSLIPVVNESETYLGCITVENLLFFFSSIASAQEPGAILVLEVNVNDYSLSEVARIAESNGARILSSYVRTHPDSTKLDLTIKLNQSDLNNVIATFENFNYSVSGYFQETGLTEDLQERYDALIRYLNM